VAAISRKMPRSLLDRADRRRSPRKPDRAKPSRKVVAYGTCLVSDHPVCAAKVASRNFLTGAATPPHEGGDFTRPAHRSQFTHTFIDRQMRQHVASKLQPNLQLELPCILEIG